MTGLPTHPGKTILFGETTVARATQCIVKLLVAMAELPKGLVVDVAVLIGKIGAVDPDRQSLAVVFHPFADTPARCGDLFLRLVALECQFTLGIHDVSHA
ncbi:hypothetical protein D3C84_1093660 [compost metagenome]